MTVITIKKSSVEGKIPLADDLAVAELAVNLKDRKLYTKDADGNVVALGGQAQVPGGDTPPTDDNKPGDLFWDTATEQLLYWDGTQWLPIAGDEAIGITDLTDVTIDNSVADGQVLAYDSGSGEWVNVSPASLSVDVDLAYDATTNTVTNSAGDDAVLTVVDAVNAGLMEPADKAKLDGLEINDATITVNDSNGDEVGTFTVNQAVDSVIALPAPPDLSTYIQETDSIGRLGDVDLSTPPTEKQVLTFNGTNWVAAKSDGGGGTGVDKIPASIPGSSLVTSETTISSANGFILSRTSEEDDSALGNNRTYLPATVIIFDWAPGVFDAVAHDDTVEDTVTLKSAVSDLTEVETYLVDKVPDAFTLSVLTDVVVGGVVEDPEIITLAGINAPIKVWGTTTSEGAEVSINGAAYVALPEDDTSTLVANVGETVQVRHTTPATALAAVETQLVIGWSSADSTNATFATTSMDAGVATPTWTAPTEGEADVSLDATFIASAFSSFGGAGNHLNTDWQVCSDASFLTIVEESLADATNKTSWTPTSLLPQLTPLYARVRYRADGASALVSSWSEVSFTTINLLPPLVNGTATLSPGNTWTVPELIGTVRFEVEGSAGINGTGTPGGKACATYSVTAGDVFRIDSIPAGRGVRAGSSLMIGPDGGTTLNQGSLWLAAGAEGGPRNTSQGSNNAYGGGNSGARSSQTEDGGQRSGAGGSQSGGGSGGTQIGEQNPNKIGGVGSALQGGNAASDNADGTGAGGGGWYGGGGGSAPGGWGGGGSGRVQGPNPVDSTNEQNKGSSNNVKIIW